MSEPNAADQLELAQDWVRSGREFVEYSRRMAAAGLIPDPSAVAGIEDLAVGIETLALVVLPTGHSARKPRPEQRQ